jgi:hypothetical protein
MPNGIDLGAASFAMEAGADGQPKAVSRTATSEQTAFLMRAELWRWLAAQELNNPARVRELFELEALHQWGADLIMTEDPDLLRLRDHQFLQPLNVMTPPEAFVLIGVWSRVVHAAFVAGPLGVNVGLHHWAFAHALTPAAWRALRALDQVRRIAPESEDVFDLLSSILDRLGAISRAFDRLFATSQCESNNDTLSELLDEFDRIVLGSWAVYDSVSLLVGTYFHVKLAKPYMWSLLNETWASKLAALPDSRAGAIAALVHGEGPVLHASQAIRHQLGHRARLVTVRAVRPRQPEAGRVWVSGDTLRRLEQSLAELRISAVNWGVEDVIEAGRIAVMTGDDPSASYETDHTRQALVDPTVLAARIATHAAWLANETIRLLDLPSDRRVRDKAACDQLPSSVPGADWTSARGANVAILSSPLSGLIHWRWPIPPRAG